MKNSKSLVSFDTVGFEVKDGFYERTFRLRIRADFPERILKLVDSCLFHQIADVIDKFNRQYLRADIFCCSWDVPEVSPREEVSGDA